MSTTTSPPADPFAVRVGGHVADADAYTYPLSIALRRRKDGFTRIEVTIHQADECEVGNPDDRCFKGYLSDQERRELAAVLLDGLVPDARSADQKFLEESVGGRMVLDLIRRRRDRERLRQRYSLTPEYAI